MLYLAKALIKTNQKEEAKEVLKKIIGTEPDSLNYIEDLHYRHEAKTIWDNNYLK